MAAEDNFIVAIVLGSSKITAVAGRKQPDGAIQVLAYAQEPSDTFIRKGRINNVTKMKQCIFNMKESLEKTLKKSINYTYVGIGGMGMHTIANTVSRQFNEKTLISQDLVDDMLNDNKLSATAERDIFEVVPQEFKIGTQHPIDPIGIQSESIEGHYLNIVAKGDIREDIESCFRNAGFKIADTPISVLTLSDSMLSESEKRSGCVFVDMGSETTSVAVFKNNLLRHFAVIPLGSANINRDITSLQIEDKEAEELKLQYGSALYDTDLESQNPIKLKDNRQVKFEEFAGLVESRMEEIILNITHQIELSKYDQSQLIGGIIVTGGTANMKNIDKAFERHTRFEKVRFVTKGGIKMQVRSNFDDFNKDGSFNTALAIIDKGEFNCCGGELGTDAEPIQEEESNELLKPATVTPVQPQPADNEVPAQPAANNAERFKPEEIEDEDDEEEETVSSRRERRKKKKPNVFTKFINSISRFATKMVSDDDTIENKSK